MFCHHGTRQYRRVICNAHTLVNTRLPHDADASPQFCPTAYPRLGEDERTLAHLDVMGKFHEIADDRPVTNDSIGERAALYDSIASNLHIIAQDAAPLAAE